MTRIFDALLKGGGEPARMLSQAVDRDAIAASPLVSAAEPQIRVLSVRPSSKAVLPFAARSGATEQYRFLRTRIAQDPDQPRVVAITSGNQQDGKTVTAINLSAILSLKDGAKVLLMDADMRRPSIARSLGLPDKPGLVDVLSGRTSLADALIRTSEYPDLYVLTGGGRANNAPELLDTTEWRSLCQLAAQRFRFVVLDSPPFGPIADYELIQATADKVIVVVRPDRTPRPACYQALQAIPRAKLMGVAFNDVKQWPFSRHFGYYYHDEGYYASPSVAAASKEGS